MTDTLIKRPLDSVFAARKEYLLSQEKKTSVSTETPIPSAAIVPDADSVILPIALIDIPEQPRTSFDSEIISAHIQSIADSIRAHYQFDPISVHVNPDDPGRYILEAGECRLRAVRDILKREAIRATIVQVNLSEFDFKLRQMLSNDLREDFRPIERAKAWLELKNCGGLSNRALADKLLVSESKVSKYLSLLDAPDEIQEGIEAGHIAPRHWWNNKNTVLESIDSCPYGFAKPANKNTTPSKAKPKTKKKPLISIPDNLAVDILMLFEKLCEGRGIDLVSAENDVKSIQYALAKNTQTIKELI